MLGRGEIKRGTPTPITHTSITQQNQMVKGTYLRCAYDFRVDEPGDGEDPLGEVAGGRVDEDSLLGDAVATEPLWAGWRGVEVMRMNGRGYVSWVGGYKDETDGTVREKRWFIVRNTYARTHAPKGRGGRRGSRVGRIRGGKGVCPDEELELPGDAVHGHRPARHLV